MTNGHYLSQRGNWQRLTQVGGHGREQAVRNTFFTLFYDRENCPYVVYNQPRIVVYDSGDVVDGFVHDSDRGIQPDCAIENTETGKLALIEVKRQGHTGNAHERLCRNYMLGLQKPLERECGFRYPIFTICVNGLANEPHKAREITKWFDHPDIQDRVFLWKTNDPKDLIDFFQHTIKRYID